MAFPKSRDTLDPGLTFETFAVSDGNRLAHAAALAVGEFPGEAYNPVALLGGTGLGKTHLLHAIGNDVVTRSLSVPVWFGSADTALAELAGAAFADRATRSCSGRSTAVVLIDDAERVNAQFHYRLGSLVTALLDGGAQIVLAFDSAVQELAVVDEWFGGDGLLATVFGATVASAP